MSIIVTDTGFAPEHFHGAFSAIDALDGAEAVDLGPAADVTRLTGRLDGIGIIRIAFPSFADGRGFTLARRLRLMGYTGRLRAAGHVIADQYAMARRAGFDEVEISEELAQRQPEGQWLFRADWQAHDYRTRLRA